MAATQINRNSKTLDASDVVERKLAEARAICAVVRASASSESELLPDGAIEGAMLAVEDLIKEARAAADHVYQEWRNASGYSR